jgi:neutral ceramidase
MELKAGTSKVDITPNIGSPTRRWHLPDERARITDIRWPLYARTVALSDGHTTATVTSMDIACLYKCHHDHIRELVRQMSPVPIDHVILHNTHQHSDSFVEYEPAYDIFGLDRVAFDMDYIRGLARRIATSICLAVQHMTPARVGHASGAVEEGIASNRRFIKPDGTSGGRCSRPTPELRALPRGHIDPEVGVLALTSPAGEPLATLYNYACHPSAVGGDSPSVCSADYPGYASHMVETCYGGTALFLHGCTGDINPAKYVRGDSLAFDDRIADAKRMGQIMAGEVLKTLGMIEMQDVCRFEVRAKACTLPVQPEAGNVEQALAKAHQAIENWKQRGADPRTALRKYVISRKIINGEFSAALFALKINDLAAAFLPGEPFTELGERIKKASAAGRTLVASTCGEDPFYMPTREELVRGGYEAGYIATAETGETLVREVNHLIETCA